MSTNDTVVLQATGAAGAPLPEGLLDAVLLQLALEIVADGEGATRVGRVEVREARDDDEAERVARAIANSPLVKTALFGRDPNWGRIAQAAGQALAGEELAGARRRPDRSRPSSGRRTPEAELCGRSRPRRIRARMSTSATSPTTTSASTRSTRHDRTKPPPHDEPLSNASVATLLEALPYIRQFHGRTIVIKYGGAAMRDEELREAFATDVVLLKYVGMNPVIVHGGGPEITDYMERLGMEVKFVEGLRVSDEETVEVAKMVLLGKINSDILTRLKRHGQPAVGLGGEDGGLFEVRPVGRVRGGRPRRRDRARQRRRDRPHRRGLRAGDRLGRHRPRRPLLQRQRRRGGGQGRRRDAGPEGDLPHRRRRLARATPTTPRSRISQATVDEVEHGARRDRGRHAPEARRLRRGGRRRRRGLAHHRRPQGRTPCCSSSSPTPASARRSPRGAACELRWTCRRWTRRAG